MYIPVRIGPANAIGRNFRMGSKIPMKAVTGNGSKEYKVKKVIVGELPYNKLVGLPRHYHRTACDENIAVNE